MNMLARPELVTPFSLKDAPALIEKLLPAQKVSIEAQKERKAGSGQTLTALGSYWKGRKPLILVRACVLGALLPATDDPEKDLEIFEKLMAFDDASFLARGISLPAGQVARLAGPTDLDSWFEPSAKATPGDSAQDRYAGLAWKRGLRKADKERLTLKALSRMSYAEKCAAAKKRPEHLSPEAYAGIWPEVNAHLGTRAFSHQELVEQLGIMRFGRRPVVADTFAGGGSIPFEAARLGCEAHASDINPIACMLNWGNFDILCATPERKAEIENRRAFVLEEMERRIAELGIEHDSMGNRAKYFFYCVETRCPSTGWLVPMLPTRILSKKRNVIVRLVPDRKRRRFDIQVETGVSAADMKAAETGTVKDGALIYELDSEVYSTPVRTIRGDYRMEGGGTANRLRKWEKTDFIPRDDDIFQERLYAIQWIRSGTETSGRPETFFASVTDEDLAREAKVNDIVASNIAAWQEAGFVPDMRIEPGYNTDQPIRERGWTWWHQLFGARALLMFAMFREITQSIDDGYFAVWLASMINRNSRLCQWLISDEKGQATFYNQALNTLWNPVLRGFQGVADLAPESDNIPLKVHCTVDVGACSRINCSPDLAITDPPYADAVQYHEITEFFISWLRKNPPSTFREWVWDSQRTEVIKGSDDDFRRDMARAYKALADAMPENGLQIVMFTHQDTKIWADMARIFWAAGLKVTAAWYIATETTSGLKTGGYVQGTIILVLRKRVGSENAWQDDLIPEIRREAEAQNASMIGLDQHVRRRQERSENLYNDADRQMAGYAAGLRVLTSYAKIDGKDMALEAMRPRIKGEPDFVADLIEIAVQTSNAAQVPDQLAIALWDRLTGPERFYLKMLTAEAAGESKLDSYQNFAKAFKVADWNGLMASQKPNAARLKSARELGHKDGTPEFGATLTRFVLEAVRQLLKEMDVDEAIVRLRDRLDEVGGYLERRDDVAAVAEFLATTLERLRPEEASAARTLAIRVRSQRLS